MIGDLGRTQEMGEDYIVRPKYFWNINAVINSIVAI